MIKNLKIKGYRNLDFESELQKTNLVVAPNGSGKSNLLEAIYLSTLGRSFRPVQSLQEYINMSADFAKVEIVSIHQDRLELIMAGESTIKRKYIWNNKQKPVSKLVGNIPVILFAPHSVNLVNEDPAGRRADLDDFLSILSADYTELSARYRKILKNRNALLKHIRDNNGDRTELRYWTNEILKLAVQINAFRQEFFDSVNDFLVSTADKVYSKEAGFAAEFVPNSAAAGLPYAEALQSKYEQNQEKEIIVGQTLYGPHKDDYILSLAGQDLRYLGSRGEQRLAVLVWKLAQHEYLYKTREKNALLLIDDVMSELDVAHRNKVAEVLLTDDRYQTIITSADIGDVPESIIDSASRLVLRLS